MEEWYQYAKTDEKPDDIPSSPDIIYKNDGWISLGDWLGTGSIATKNRVYLSFKEAREFARSLKLNASREWFQYAKTDEKPDDIPGNPRDAYLNDGWISWGDWVGTEWRPFDEARGFARSLKLRGVEEWYQYAKTDEKPNDIPAAPSYVYKNDGWKDWIDWLGNEDRIVSEETKRKMSEAAKGRKKPL